MTLENCILMLRRLNCSCVIGNGKRMTFCSQRGVKDLLELLHTEPQLLDGAMIADKVVGKGAAALMVLGGVKSVYAGVISEPAIALLDDAGIALAYSERVPNIINRAGTGICPVEELCAGCATPEECLPLIEDFVGRQQTKSNQNH